LGARTRREREKELETSGYVRFCGARSTYYETAFEGDSSTTTCIRNAVEIFVELSAERENLDCKSEDMKFTINCTGSARGKARARSIPPGRFDETEEGGDFRNREDLQEQ